MSDKKIIIRNCPCYIDMPLHNHDKVCRLGDIVKPNHKELYVYCQDCTDCVMKQIVGLCKSACIDCSSIKRVTYTQCKDLNNCKTAKILKLLDIQEVE